MAQSFNALQRATVTDVPTSARLPARNRVASPRADEKTIEIRRAIAADDYHLAAGLRAGLTSDEAKGRRRTYRPSEA